LGFYEVRISLEFQLSLLLSIVYVALRRTPPPPHCFCKVMIPIELSSTITKKLFILKTLAPFWGSFFRDFSGGTKTRSVKAEIRSRRHPPPSPSFFVCADSKGVAEIWDKSCARLCHLSVVRCDEVWPFPRFGTESRRLHRVTDSLRGLVTKTSVYYS
jgi:hypothetical protein